MNISIAGKASALLGARALRNAGIVLGMMILPILSMDLGEEPEKATYDGIMLTVAHDTYGDAGPLLLRAYGHLDQVFCDLKSVFGRSDSDLRL